jgi:hypothetical protein
MHPDYYKKTGITIEAMDVMQYLPASLANAFKYLVRAGYKPGNAYETEIDKADTYLEQFLWSDVEQTAHPDAWCVLKFFCTHYEGDLYSFCQNASSLKDWAKNAHDFIHTTKLNIARDERLRGYQNEVARLKHMALPYPDEPSKSEEIHHDLCVLADLNRANQKSPVVYDATKLSKDVKQWM